MTTMEQSVDAGVYAGRVARTLNSGFIALMISIGHRTGLFDVLAALPPSTSADIARAAGLAERYVREWLSSMTAAHFVQHDARTSTWFLPVEYASVLARGAGSDNLAPVAELLSLAAGAEDLVVASFRGGGGIAPEAYVRLAARMAEAKRQTYDESYAAALLELVPGMRVRLERGARVLDAGCGDGALLTLFARLFPRSAFCGIDLSRDAIRRACGHANEAGLSNVAFAVAETAGIEEREAYDLVLAFESIHEHGDPVDALRAIARALTGGGALLMQEIAASSDVSRNAEQPFAPMLYALSCMHSLPVALAQGGGDAPGRMWGRERALRMLREAGFETVRVGGLASDPLRDYTVAARRAI